VVLLESYIFEAFGFVLSIQILLNNLKREIKMYINFTINIRNNPEEYFKLLNLLLNIYLHKYQSLIKKNSSFSIMCRFR
jgi:hypothetical protein